MWGLEYIVSSLEEVFCSLLQGWQVVLSDHGVAIFRLSVQKLSHLRESWCAQYVEEIETKRLQLLSQLIVHVLHCISHKAIIPL